MLFEVDIIRLPNFKVHRDTLFFVALAQKTRKKVNKSRQELQRTCLTGNGNSVLK